MISALNAATGLPGGPSAGAVLVYIGAFVVLAALLGFAWFRP